MTKKLYNLLLIITLTLVFVNGNAQSEKDGIKAAIQALFDGMRSSDTAMIRSAFSNSALLQTIGSNKEGRTIIHSSVLDSFIVAIGRPRQEIYDERISFESILIHGNLASVWTPYRFYLGEKFLHCGVN